jgi:hypothetical protein
MTHPVTRAAAWLLNRCPAWCSAWVPMPVLEEAIRQLREPELRAIAQARAALILGELRQQLEQR